MRGSLYFIKQIFWGNLGGSFSLSGGGVCFYVFFIIFYYGGGLFSGVSPGEFKIISIYFTS